MARFKITENAYPHFVTCTIVKWLPVFVSSLLCDIIIESLKFCREQKGLKIYAYVIMPTHIHLIVSADDLSGVLRDFKKHTAFRIAQYFKEHNNLAFPNVFRFCTEDNAHPSKHKVWQDGNQPEQIHSQPFFLQKCSYIHENPFRKGLILDAAAWKYSSIRAFSIGEMEPLAIDWIDW